jgi:hypothetical protein
MSTNIDLSNNPLCFGCKQECLVRVCTKGPDRGRRFWACQSAIRGGTCARWNGWIDPGKSLSKSVVVCSVCFRHVDMAQEINNNIDKISGLISTHNELKKMVTQNIKGQINKEGYVCEGCREKYELGRPFR